MSRSFNCAACGSEAIVGATTPSYAKKRYCSRRCWNIHAGAIAVCEECGREFKNRAGQRAKRCSWKCYNKSRAIPTKKCIQCGNDFSRPASFHLRKAKYCSRDCMVRWRKEHPKELSIRFYERKQDRGSDWPEASAEARRLAQNKCGTSGCDIQLNQRASVDHIIPYRLLLKLRETDKAINPNAQVNLIPLCRTHHGRKTGAETRLFRGDVIGFISSASVIIPRDRVLAALAWARL